jgi:hypothetical protein
MTAAEFYRDWWRKQGGEKELQFALTSEIIASQFIILLSWRLAFDLFNRSSSGQS